ncbi:NAD-dependent epimerase/dehydratase family protein [Nitrosopumilus piranensis]|uniref:Putative NAD-dependent epimerase/dehydratase n=1 Tax=Nitrosopumilus piranensis TaxID=1582439 RepID=A0A0C5C7Q2_9ARCH|nr:NAD(P)-dependent oxidoreductase [Nitrosopumilus piranensis]AJM91277.1 putative NAD-dependent epimerase/dehydratase [Nitrosopumilus piranensis]
MIIVTGSESFVGRNLIKKLLENNKKIMGVDLVEDKSQHYEYVKKDIRDKTLLDSIPDNAEALIHLAALSSDPMCKGKSYDCFDVNVMGTLNLIDIGKKKNIKQFIFASTEWVYEGFQGNEEKDENSKIDISEHTSEYALSKLVSEINLKQENQNGLSNITILRFGIIYGPRKNNWSAFESIASAVKNSDNVSVGSLKTGRRFIHVNDICDGIISSLNLTGINTINLSGNKIITLEDIIDTSQKIFKKKVKISEKNSENVSIRNPSNEKAKKLLKWEPKIGLEEGIKNIKEFL